MDPSRVGADGRRAAESLSVIVGGPVKRSLVMGYTISKKFAASMRDRGKPICVNTRTGCDELKTNA